MLQTILEALQIEKTLLIQLINIAILFLILRWLLAKPIKQTIEERRKRAEEILERQKQIEERLKKIQEEEKTILKNAQLEAQKILEEANNQAKANAKAIIEKARKEREELLQTFKEHLKQQEKQLKEQIKAQVATYTIKTLKAILEEDPKLRKEVVDKILERYAK